MELKTSWQEKLADNKGLPKIVSIEGKMSKRWGTGTMFVPAPRQVDALMKKVPKGKVTTIKEIRETLARQHGTTIGCPLTTGIFAWIAAHAAEEAAAEGKVRITPYWRTLKAGGEINPKYPGGIAKQKAILESEGHEILKKGAKHIVADFENKQVKAEMMLVGLQSPQSGWRKKNKIKIKKAKAPK
jgi:alkylated DNA nucleotide flippase Atl1